MTLAEGVQLVSFGLLAVLVIGSALGVVLLSNIVYSAFLLGGVFISISGLYVLLNAGFVAAAQILIYVGAVNILILFGIMLVNKREDFVPVRRGWIRLAATSGVCFGLFALLSTVILGTPWQFSTDIPIGDEATILIGKHFFSDFLLPFELASVLLLMALVGAIILARREFIADERPADSVSDALKLPERPRELVPAGRESSSEE
ncbi:NADH-quinone oxidoreductase subunit J [Oscillatoria sp. CS-180]|uniref:NADH-quinone oxidoreductase subunit J n=1 Tax=Oscillatoria sp. CS-180 TaxID=3021720 RepID=UPI00232D758B|nr:NADH-quinone oxidoreductase subunit J [Oscillatoria sp. CS-180]MDB9528671.1 NADH-quinone oxidoreductase subunit J [Oscillatoria sp. CS-180]